MKINPELIKLARAELAKTLARDNFDKAGFVPLTAIKASQGMPPGAPGAPMPPAGPTPPAPPPPPGAPMPQDPSMGGMPPGGDPSMGGMPPGGDPSMGGMPPGGDPSMGGMPPGGDPSMGGQPIQVNLEDLIQLFAQISQEQGGPSPEAGGPNEGSESSTTNKQIGQRIDALDEKLDMIMAALGAAPQGGMPPEMAAGMPGGEGAVPDELAAAMGGGMPPEAMAGGAPMGAMGGSLPPEAIAGAQEPMLAGGMPVSASDRSGLKKSSATSISALAARLRKR